jgi:hypothetical protein
MQSWGFQEEDFAMKKLVVKMEIESLWKAMTLSFIETTSLSIFPSMKSTTHLFYE